MKSSLSPMFIDLGLLISWLLTYKYALLFPAAVIEGPLVTILAGFLVSQGQLNGPLSVLLIIIADLVGDAIYYLIGKWGGLYFVTRWGKYVGIKSENILDFEKKFDYHAGKNLVIGKLSHGIGVVALIAAGVARINFWKFLWYNFLPSIPKTIALLLVGFYFGAVYNRIIQYLDYLALIMVILGVALVFGIYIFSRRLRDKSESKTL